MGADPLIRFRGQRHVGGYQIRNDKTSGTPILTPVPAKSPRPSGWGEETLASMRRTLASMRITQETLQAAEVVLDKSATEDYQPPEALFRAFAELETDTQIVAFANRFGLLGVEGKMTVVPVFTRKMEKDIEWTETVAIHGEPLGAWRREIAAVQQVLENWHTGQSNEHYAPLARLDVQELVNERLNQPLRLALDGDRYRLELAPKTLLAFIWARLALALAGGISVRRCLGGCGKWLVIQRSGPASRRLTCTPACRIRAHHRRVEARRLRKRMGVKKVAERLETDAATVEELIAVKGRTEKLKLE